MTAPGGSIPAPIARGAARVPAGRGGCGTRRPAWPDGAARLRAAHPAAAAAHTPGRGATIARSARREEVER
jgi:hypothetical protein